MDAIWYAKSSHQSTAPLSNSLTCASVRGGKKIFAGTLERSLEYAVACDSSHHYGRVVQDVYGILEFNSRYN